MIHLLIVVLLATWPMQPKIWWESRGSWPAALNHGVLWTRGQVDDDEGHGGAGAPADGRCLLSHVVAMVVVISTTIAC